MRRIRITAGGMVMDAELNDTAPAESIWEALPLRGEANVWGQEIYFGVPVHIEEDENARCEVDVGTLAYWAPGSAFCIFFGPTPVSTGSMPMAASPVNILGIIDGDARALARVPDGAPVVVERAGE